MVKVDLITGFLGSGKTTFIKKYAQYLIDQGYRIGIIENDFGAVNVDMMLLQDLESEQEIIDKEKYGFNYIETTLDKALEVFKLQNKKEYFKK